MTSFCCAHHITDRQPAIDTTSVTRLSYGCLERFGTSYTSMSPIPVLGHSTGARLAMFQVCTTYHGSHCGVLLPLRRTFGLSTWSILPNLTHLHVYVHARETARWETSTWDQYGFPNDSEKDVPVLFMLWGLAAEIARQRIQRQSKDHAAVGEQSCCYIVRRIQFLRVILSDALL